MARPKGQVTMESWMIANGKIGQHFYSDREDKYITAISTYYGRRVKTERLITVTAGKKTPESKYITKVTLL